MLDSARSGTKPRGPERVRVVSVNPNQPRKDRLSAAVSCLAGGGVVALPTETFYGLAGNAFDVRALERLNHAKRRPPGSPILLLLADPEQVRLVADDVPPRFNELTQMFWPGPLTLVIPAAARVPQLVTVGRGTVAVRMPGLPLPRRIAHLLERPLTGVSANLHGQPPCRSAAEVAEVFRDSIDMILDGGATSAGVPSTIVDLSTDRPRVLREGLLPSASLERFLPDLVHASRSRGR